MLAASANPRRIDEDEFFAAPLIGNIDRIACRSREVAHNRSPILQDRRTIVSDLPGTTRDAVDISYERSGEKFILIDTAGIRARSKHSSSVEVFSVMRAERTIRRAHLCVLVVDATSGVTSQDKKIAGLIQKAEKPCVVVLNKWDLVKPKRATKA